MPNVELNDHLYERLTAFKPLLEAVIEDEVSLEACIDLVLDHGLSAMLLDVIGDTEPRVLLASMQQLASQHPEVLYGFIASTMKAGGAEVEREKARHRFGFGLPTDDS